MTACMAPKEESKTTKFDLSHPRALRVTDEIPTPTSELVQIRQKGTTYVHDSGYLVDGKIKVNVPLDTYIYVEYESHQSPHTERLGSGFSDEFIVTASSPNSLTIGIPVGYNNDHPYFEVQTDNTTDNTTLTCTGTDCDNTTIVTTGDKFSWADNFSNRIPATITQSQKYQDFWDNVSVSDNWTKISVGTPENLVSCDKPSEIISRFKANGAASTSYTCEGRKWYVGRCGQGPSISVYNTGSGSTCSCNNSGVWTVRPLIGSTNNNWGGVGKDCRAPSQTLTVIFER